MSQKPIIRTIREEPVVTVHDILRRASMITGYPEKAILGTSKASDLFRIRAAIVFAARGLPRASYAKIARILQRDHSTIISAERRAIEWRTTDPAFRDLCRRLMPASPPPASVELQLRGFDTVIVRQDSGNAPAATPKLAWGHVGQLIILVMTAEDGTSLSAQIDVHQLHAMARDLTGIVQSMSPCPPAERTLQ